MARRAPRRPARADVAPRRRDLVSAALHPSGASIVRRLVVTPSSPARRSRLAVDVVVWSARRLGRLVRRQPETIATERLRAGQAVRIDTFRRMRRRSAR